MRTMNFFKNNQRYETVPAGKTIFRRGELGQTMYVVLEGQVDIVLNGTLLETVAAGGILGEMAMISQTPRSATAIALTDCKLVPVEKEQFKSLLEQTPYFAQTILTIMVERLRRMDDFLVANSEVGSY